MRNPGLYESASRTHREEGTKTEEGNNRKNRGFLVMVTDMIAASVASYLTANICAVGTLAFWGG